MPESLAGKKAFPQSTGKAFMYEARAAESMCKRMAIVPNLLAPESTLIPPSSAQLPIQQDLFQSKCHTKRQPD